ncbi:MAG TPA: hypothetical protein VLT47_11915 [Anaeromyxobacteraceae bacterium]|nr:hypothetical protein [Anaeromyxobacteraceae bacterium]
MAKRAPAWLAAALASASVAATGCAPHRRAATPAPSAPPPALAARAADASTPEAPPGPSPVDAAPAPGPRALPEPDRTQPPWSQTPVPPIALGEVQRDRVEGGRHARIGTERGVVHAWRPRGYRQRDAGTVVYLHGYYTDVDQAWADHRLAEQFRRSGRNALFLAIESPSWNGEGPSWPTLEALFEAVERLAKLRIPGGPLVVAAHSGGFRGIVPWLANPRIGEVLLLDGLYQSERSWAEWLDAAPRGKRRLVLVGLETAARSEAWLPSRAGAVLLPRVPEKGRGLKKSERRAPVLYMRSQQDHMAIIGNGEILPLLLRDGRLRGHPVGTP